MGVTGVVLAAGRGVRMGGIDHKALIPIRDKQPLMHYILAGLRASGIEELLIVTGHRPDAIQEYVGPRWSGEVTYARNPRFASWGNFHSLRLAIDQQPSNDLLVTNCDIVVNPDVYRRVASRPGDLVLAVERRYRLDEEDMRVAIRDDRVVGIGKGLPLALSHGEFCGISMLRVEGHRRYLELATEAEWSGRTHIYYEDVYGAMLDTVETRPAPVDAGEYAEVDEPSNVEDAARVIARYGAAYAALDAGASA